MIKLTTEIQNKLLSLPESGMGYQIVEATYSNYSRKECIVLNATIAEPTYDRNVRDVLKSVSLEEANRVYKFASVSTEIIDVKLKVDKGIFKASAVKLSEAKGADKAPEELTKKGEQFIRFSPFEDDRRIDKVNKKARPGTYATTKEDAKYCLDAKINPIERYALPSILPIKYTFDINPWERTIIQKGIVEPANDQPGGGEEVLFPKGTDNNTVVLPPHNL